MGRARLRAALAVALATAAVALFLRYETAERRVTGEASSCRITDTLDCDAVQDSRYAAVLGVPLSVWGGAGALALFGLLLAARRGEPAFLAAAGGVAALSGVAVVYTAAVSWFVLGKVCLYCTAMQLGSVVLAILVVPPGWRARREVRARPVWLAGTIGAAVLAVALAGEAYAAKRTSLLRLFTLPGGNAMRLDVSDTLVLGDPATPISVLVFFHFKCPHCRDCFRVATALVEKYPRCVHYRFKHHPLERDCNPELRGTGAVGACQAAVAGQAARSLGLDAQAMKLLFDHQEQGFGKLVLDKVASDLGIAPDKWAALLASPRIRALVDRDIREANALRLRGVPVAYVNGRSADPGRLAETIGRLCGK
jgi:uncharacterized membrane protein/predicted DsbA family dithiol-disulfide isomerase